MKISSIRAIEILDSRGNPTVRTFVTLENGMVGSASVPSGASTGAHEACELRDNDQGRYLGKGVLIAVENVNTSLNTLLSGMSVDDLGALDKKMIDRDGTENKNALGANAILSVSLAAARARALAHSEPLWKTLHDSFFNTFTPAFPRLMVNVVNGGKHASWNFDIQEFMICPQHTSPSIAVPRAAELFHQLGVLLKERGLSTLTGDEGGYSPLLQSNDEVFEVLQQAMEKAGQTKHDVDFAIDAAASEFYKDGLYHFKKSGAQLSTSDLTKYYVGLKNKYDLISYEDAYAEDDWDGFAQLTEKIGDTALIVGDDLFVTNVKRIRMGIEKKSANAVLIKVNQIGSLVETAEAIQLCKQAGWSYIISHRSGETEDSFIADLAYASGAQFIKAGSMCRSDRLAKYNRLLEIESLEVKQ